MISLDFFTWLLSLDIVAYYDWYFNKLVGKQCLTSKYIEVSNFLLHYVVYIDSKCNVFNINKIAMQSKLCKCEKREKVN